MNLLISYRDRVDQLYQSANELFYCVLEPVPKIKSRMALATSVVDVDYALEENTLTVALLTFSNTLLILVDGIPCREVDLSPVNRLSCLQQSCDGAVFFAISQHATRSTEDYFIVKNRLHSSISRCERRFEGRVKKIGLLGDAGFFLGSSSRLMILKDHRVKWVELIVPNRQFECDTRKNLVSVEKDKRRSFLVDLLPKTSFKFSSGYKLNAENPNCEYKALIATTPNIWRDNHRTNDVTDVVFVPQVDSILARRLLLMIRSIYSLGSPGSNNIIDTKKSLNSIFQLVDSTI